jgi:hypothetical protein
VVDACTVYQASKWNATSFKFDCINFRPADCSNGRQHSENWSTSCPLGQTGTINYQCLNGVTSQTSGACYANCGGQGHGSTWSVSCPSGQTGTIIYQCNNGNPVRTWSNCEICTTSVGTDTVTWSSPEISHRNVGACYQTGDNDRCSNTCGMNLPSGYTVDYCNVWHCAPYMFGGRENVCKCFECVGSKTTSTTTCTPVP